MFAFLLALLPELEGAFAAEHALAGIATAIGTEGAAKALGAVTLEEWLSIAEKLAAAAPSVRQAWAALHPAFDEFAGAIARNAADRVRAANDIRGWFAANQPTTISGYGRDGGVTDIPNPDR